MTEPLDALDQADEEASDLPPAARLAALADAYCRFALENPASFRVMFGAPELCGDGPEQVALRWRTAVARLAETGLRLTPTPDAAAVSVWSTVHGRLVLGRAASGTGSADDMHAFVEELTRSLAAAGPAAD
ncbi:TetR-like C-terminal domain-containing protein [Streptomyces sp. Wh19]|uniref:TetR-like C-terminal domain-containing protein n=1 Tax=Streptomyces sanglieri TaxID=193460 RepID=A0ABW2X8D9_9ACTN|nr:TetR-like C-terminal domain-containing protein [Streptomyces sp. Wh19]MDV9201468.1 TetR-like C-terminal domain-containing protein [Streptomyces sp. Wh19]